MSYARLDDELIDHEKLAVAAHAIGRDGRAIALGFYVAAILWCLRQGTGGVIRSEVIDQFRHLVVKPRAIADALVVARLFDKHPLGYSIHDYADYNESKEEQRQRRKYERDRKRVQRAGNGHA